MFWTIHYMLILLPKIDRHSICYLRRDLIESYLAVEYENRRFFTKEDITNESQIL